MDSEQLEKIAMKISILEERLTTIRSTMVSGQISRLNEEIRVLQERERRSVMSRQGFSRHNELLDLDMWTVWLSLPYLLDFLPPNGNDRVRVAILGSYNVVTHTDEWRVWMENHTLCFVLPQKVWSVFEEE